MKRGNQYPYGKLNEHDEGAHQVLIGQEQGNVVLDFGKPVAWIALPPQEAAGLASLILRHARAVARTTGEVIEFQM